MAIEALPQARHDNYSCERFEYEISGRMQVPVATDDGAACFVAKMHARMQRLCISWVAEKWGEPPSVPHPVLMIYPGPTPDPTLVFLEGWRGAALPVLDDSVKGRFWKMEGQYLYAILSGTGITADPAPDFKTGSMPFDTLRSSSSNTIPGTYFKHDIIDSTQPS